MKKEDLNIKSGGLSLNHQNMDLKVITGGLAIGNVWLSHDKWGLNMIQPYRTNELNGGLVMIWVCPKMRYSPQLAFE